MKTFMGCLAAIGLMAVVIFLFWLIVNAFVWAISLCFGVTYTLLFGTGVWLVILFIIFVVNLIRGGNKNG